MKLKNAIDLSEQVPVAPATQSPAVKGLPKTVGSIVRRKVPAGYTEISKKKKKKVPVAEDVGEALPMQQREPVWDKNYLTKAFVGNRPKYRPKKNFLNKSPEDLKKKKKKTVAEQFMGPQIFNQDSPYKDLEFLTKFWKGDRSNSKEWRPPNRLKKTEKKKKKENEAE